MLMGRRFVICKLIRQAKSLQILNQTPVRLTPGGGNASNTPVLSVLIFLGVAGAAWLLLSQLTAGPPAQPSEEIAPPHHGGGIDPEKFARVMAAPPTEKSLRQHARKKHLGFGIRVEVGPMTDEEEAFVQSLDRRGGGGESKQVDLAAWRDTLVPAPFAVGCPFELTIVYREEAPARQIEVRELLQGEHACYLESWCHLRQDRRMFRVDEIDEVITADGEIFGSGDEWLASLPT